MNSKTRNELSQKLGHIAGLTDKTCPEAAALARECFDILNGLSKPQTPSFKARTKSYVKGTASDLARRLNDFATDSE